MYMTYHYSVMLEARISDQSLKIYQVAQGYQNISVGDIVVLHDGGMLPTVATQ